MNQKVVIIAEAGVNHNGDIDRALELVKKAAEAGVDFIKFQTFKAEKLVCKSAQKAAYQSANMGDSDSTQFEMLKKLELTDDDHQRIIEECEIHGVKFLSTAFDIEGLNFLKGIGLPFFKVPSGEITNYPYLKHLAEFGVPVILSTGMADLDEIRQAVQVLMKNGINKSSITILHCNTEYPTLMEDVNLKAMQAIEKEFGVAVGYSDHTLGIEVPIAAVALGAKVIEKHFTLDRTLSGPDHRASLEPQELSKMVDSIRNIEKAISGSGKKEPSKSELKNKTVARKSIHSSRAIKKGQVLKETDLISLRPGNGISPMRWDDVVGKSLNRDLDEFEMIQEVDLV